MEMEAEGASSNSNDEVCGLGRGFYERLQVAPTTPAGQQGPSRAAEHSERSSSHGYGYSMGRNHAPPLPVRSVLEQGTLDSSTPSGHQTDSMIYSLPAVNIPNIVLTPALSFRSQGLTAHQGEQFRSNMVHSWDLLPSPEDQDGTLNSLESFNGGQQSRFPNAGPIMMEDCSSDFMPNAHRRPLSPRGPFAVDMDPSSTVTSVPFSQYHQTAHSQNLSQLTDLTQREKQQRIHSTTAIGQGVLPSNLTDTPPTYVPQRAQQDPIHPNPSSNQLHVVPKLYNPGRILSPEVEITELEVRHHYLPFHNLPSLVPRKFGDGGPMVGPSHECFRNLRSDSSFSSSSVSSNETITGPNATHESTNLADLVRESDPMLPSPKAGEKDAGYISPSAATYLNPTAVPTPGSAFNDLWYFPGDRDFLWTYSRSLPTEAEFQAHYDNDATIFPHREIMATYTSTGGWRTMPRGSYAGSRFGAIGERLVPRTMQEVGEVGRPSTHEDIETDAPR